MAPHSYAKQLWGRGTGEECSNASRKYSSWPAPGVTHKQLEELEDALVGQDVQRVPRVRIDDRQAVDLVPDQGGDCIIQAGSHKFGGSISQMRSNKDTQEPDKGCVKSSGRGRERKRRCIWDSWRRGNDFWVLLLFN